MPTSGSCHYQRNKARAFEAEGGFIEGRRRGEAIQLGISRLSLPLYISVEGGMWGGGGGCCLIYG